MPESRVTRLARASHLSKSGVRVPFTEETAIEVTITREIKDLVTNVVTYQTQNSDGSWTKPSTVRNVHGGLVDIEGVDAVMAKVKELEDA